MTALDQLENVTIDGVDNVIDGQVDGQVDDSFEGRKVNFAKTSSGSYSRLKIPVLPMWMCSADSIGRCLRATRPLR
jgi:hypothetical protein